MRIVKEVIGNMEIDTIGKKIWLNSIDGECLLRISDLKFCNNIQKISMIDIRNSEAVMVAPNTTKEITNNFKNLTKEIIIFLSNQEALGNLKGKYEHVFNEIVRVCNNQ